MEGNNDIIEYHCTNCGNRVSREDTRCPACGAELEGFIDEDTDNSTYTIEDEAEHDKSEIQEYYCSHCGSRVSLNETKCLSCGAELDNFDDNEMTVMLKEFSTEVDADLAKTLLQSKGIECYITGGDSDGTLYSPIPFKLVVLKKDVSLALEILESKSQ